MCPTARSFRCRSGVNPLLTISALTERACALIAADRGWTIDYTLPSVPRPRPQVDTVGVEFTERMVGHFSTRALDDFLSAEQDGRATDSSFEFILTIVAEDVNKLVTDETYESGIVGTVRAPALSSQPLSVTDGRFNLLVNDPEHVGGKNMRYRMKMAAAEGNVYWFEGTKYIKATAAWTCGRTAPRSTSSVSEGAAPAGKLLGRGVLRHPPRRLPQADAGHAARERTQRDPAPGGRGPVRRVLRRKPVGRVRRRVRDDRRCSTRPPRPARSAPCARRRRKSTTSPPPTALTCG